MAAADHERIASIQRNIAMVRDSLDMPQTLSADAFASFEESEEDEQPPPPPPPQDFSDMASALLPANSDDEARPVVCPDELLTLNQRVRAAQLATAYARQQAEALNDENFLMAKRIFAWDPERHSQVRGLLLRMARCTARISEAQTTLEHEVASFLLVRKERCDPWRERSRELEAIEARLTQELERARKQYARLEERMKADRARHVEEIRQLGSEVEAAQRLCDARVDAVESILAPELPRIEESWAAEVVSCIREEALRVTCTRGNTRILIL